METKGINEKELRQLIQDVALIKNILLSEGDLTDWAKNELKRARNAPESEYISHSAFLNITKEKGIN
ncbi:hypothetical protein HY448_00405 [Candidatus Pacearchaeota archaeon]|nr:hypothetical protein [Candidatus Pacearchaeota archaeon]